MAALIPSVGSCVSRMTNGERRLAERLEQKLDDDYFNMDLCARALEQRKLPFNVRMRAGDFDPGANAIQIMTMKVSKGLEFPVVALGESRMEARCRFDHFKAKD